MSRDGDTGRREESTPGANVTRYEWPRDETPSEAVVAAVAAASGRDPVDLPALHGTVDADALDAIASDGTGDGVRVEFAYAGRTVVVDGDGWIEVESPAEE